MKPLTTLCFFMILMEASHLLAAVGCSLNDPDRDVKRLFLESTGYRTEFITIQDRGGKALAEEVEKKLGDQLDAQYETLDVPYAYYTVLKGKEPIGRIHGVNQKGMYGGIQLILATDLEGKIIAFYYQKISSPDARRFRENANTDQFIGLTLADFYFHDFEKGGPRDRIARLKSPSKSNHDDFMNTLRGIKKNLILLDIFELNRKSDSIYHELEGAEKNESM